MQIRLNERSAFVFCCLSMGISCSALAVAPQYELKAFVTPSNFGMPHGINSAGEIVGVSDLAGFGTRATRWSTDGVPQQIGYLGTSASVFAHSSAIGINNLDLIVGASSGTNAAGQFPVYWANLATTPTRLPLITVPSAGAATDVNDSGVIVGYVRPGAADYTAVRWQSSSTVGVALPGGMDHTGATVDPEQARAINNAGWIVGYGEIVPTNLSTTRAMAWSPANEAHVLLPVEFAPDAGGYHFAMGISENGIVAGTGSAYNSSHQSLKGVRGLRWDSVTSAPVILDFVSLPVEGSASNEALDVNQQGWVVGRAYVVLNGSIPASRGVLWSPAGHAYLLDELVTNLGDWSISNATAITDTGYIAVNISNNAGDEWIGRLRLIPEPSTLLLVGLPLCYAGRRRCRPRQNRWKVKEV